MSSIFNKLLDYIGVVEPDDLEEDYFEEDDLDQPDNVVSFSDKRRANNVVEMNASSHMKMIVYHPINYEDTRDIIDNLKSRKPVIVNMEDVDDICAQRILDFIAGAVYALNGTIFKISRRIFVVAPRNYDVIGNGDGDLDDDGLLY